MQQGAQRRGVGPLLIFSALAALAGLRAGQLLGVGPLLFDWEFVQLGSLALEVEAGTRGMGPVWRDLGAWTYMAHAQGTLLPVVGTVYMAELLGTNIWALHATSVLPELLALGLLLVLVRRRSSSPLVLAAAALGWILAPRAAVVWQLLPFGNHSEFLWVPLAIALLLDLRPRSSLASALTTAGMVAVLTLGFVGYRGTLATIGALVLALTLTGRLEGARRALAVVVASLVLSLWVLHSLTPPEQWAGLSGLWELLLGAPEAESSALLERFGRLFTWLPAAPSAEGSRLPYLVLLGTGLGLALWSLLRPAPTTEEDAPSAAPVCFLLLWAGVASVLAVLGDARYPQYFLHPFYAALCCCLVLPALLGSGRARAGGLALVLGLSLLGLPDGAELLRPAAWEHNRDYDGLTLWGELTIPTLDEDDLPYLRALAAEPADGRWVGEGMPSPARCGPSLRYFSRGPLPPPGSDRCDCWSPGELASYLTQRLAQDPNLALEQIGKGAAIGCDRDLAAVEAALTGLEPAAAERVLAGARSIPELP